jgi:beta-glucuronidase
MDERHEGLQAQWFKSRLTNSIPMPVPSSYEDITQDLSIRNHIGLVWYEHTTFTPMAWMKQRIVLRFGGAAHQAEVWINGNPVAKHIGGFLPFEADITSCLVGGAENRITVAVSNMLNHMHLPHGMVEEFHDDDHPEGYRRLKNHGDYYPFAGIHRPVVLYTTPTTYIRDIAVTTDIQGKSGVISYSVSLSAEGKEIKVAIADHSGEVVATDDRMRGTMTIENAKLWAPGNAYLYSLHVQIINENSLVVDSYRLPFGIRTVQVKDNHFLINGQPFQFQGFGKHEDSIIRGRGFDHVINIKDFNLLRWMGANSFRTSHYPYADEIIQLADQEGIVVIGEAPALSIWIPEEEEHALIYESTLASHKQAMKDLYDRDKNSPSVVMWSVANEVLTKSDSSRTYFEDVISYTRTLDPVRPVTIVECVQAHETKVSDLVDIVSVNRYFSWYEDSGCLELIPFQLEKDLRKWHNRFNKPVFLTEFGADAIAGLHQDPPVMFSEEFQQELIKRFLDVCDTLPFVIGTHIWAFADFATQQGITRVDGNKKGVLTRDRRPKLAAHYIRNRWRSE